MVRNSVVWNDADKEKNKNFNQSPGHVKKRCNGRPSCTCVAVEIDSANIVTIIASVPHFARVKSYARANKWRRRRSGQNVVEISDFRKEKSV